MNDANCNLHEESTPLIARMLEIDVVFDEKALVLKAYRKLVQHFSLKTTKCHIELHK